MPQAEFHCGGASSRCETMGLLAEFVIAGDARASQISRRMHRPVADLPQRLGDVT
jgi:hypothetical protein